MASRDTFFMTSNIEAFSFLDTHPYLNIYILILHLPSLTKTHQNPFSLPTDTSFDIIDITTQISPTLLNPFSTIPTTIPLVPNTSTSQPLRKSTTVSKTPTYLEDYHCTLVLGKNLNSTYPNSCIILYSISIITFVKITYLLIIKNLF